MTHHRSIQVYFADTHGGSKVGLLNPNTTLYQECPDGTIQPYNPELTAYQEYLWEHYCEDIQTVQELAGTDPLYAFHVGDITWGSKYMQEVVDTRIANQIMIGKANMLPWMQLLSLKVLTLLSGTGSHELGEGSSTYLIADALGAQFPGVQIQFANHILFTVEGIRIDAAHHGPPTGIRSWLKGNIARFYLRDMLIRCTNRGEEPPHLVVRAHYHEFVMELISHMCNGKLFESRLIVLPSYSMITDWARQKTGSQDTIVNGMVAVEVVDGSIVHVYPLLHSLDIRSRMVFR